LGHLEVSEFLEKILMSIRKLSKNTKKIIQNFRKFGITFFDARSIFFSMNKNFMEICQRQEDAGSSIIRNTSLNGLANQLVFL
jgi:hypothetical protein